MERRCGYQMCFCTQLVTKHCRVCKQVWYHFKCCQTKDWKYHKLICQPTKQPLVDVIDNATGLIPDVAAIVADYLLWFTAHDKIFSRWTTLKNHKFGSRNSLLSGIAVDQKGQVYVTDWQLNRIHVFSSQGELQHSWGYNILSSPSDIAVHENHDEIFVSDGHNRVVVFSPLGKVLRTIGEAHLKGSSGILVDSKNKEVFVVDYVSDMCIVFSTKGEHKREFTHKSMKNIPKIYFIQQYVCALDLDGIHFFSKEGVYCKTWFMKNVGCVCDNGEEVYIFSDQSNQVRVVSYEGILLRQWNNTLTNYCAQRCAMNQDGTFFVVQANMSSLIHVIQ